MIVVDTNVIGYLYLTSELSDQAEQAFLKDSHWVAPLLWRSEFRNVLAHYLRTLLLSLTDIQEIMENALQMMHNHEYEVASVQVLSLVAGSNCSAYDCEFVALAKDLKIPLVTVDKQVLKQFPELAIPLEAFITA